MAAAPTSKAVISTARLALGIAIKASLPEQLSQSGSEADAPACRFMGVGRISWLGMGKSEGGADCVYEK